MPALFFALVCVSILLDFNGLYGQDAHEYLRQSRVFFDRLQGFPPAPTGLGDTELAGGYPLAGALLRYFGLGAIRALQVVSWLAAAAALWMLELNLLVLSPGARPVSRWMFGLLGLMLAPYFLRAGITAMSDALGLAAALTALFFGLRVLELERHRDAVGFAIFAALAVTVRYALGILLALPALALVLELLRVRKYGWLAAMAAAALLALLPLWWMKAGAMNSPLEHSLVRDWSVWNFFKRSFSQASGRVTYTLPNLLYLFFPVAHPGFCLLLPALLPLARRTDAVRHTKRLLLLSMVLYLLLLGGLPHQNLRYLLPAYAILLLLFFPAWDRFFAYGLYFFKRLTYALMALALACQLFFCAYTLLPTLARNRLEHQTATALATRLKSGDVVYAFDLDIALQSYLPGISFRNLWMQRYEAFAPGSYLLFNEPALRTQWAGQNPMLNWEYVRRHYELQKIQALPAGWVLYRIVKPG